MTRARVERWFPLIGVLLMPCVVMAQPPATGPLPAAAPQVPAPDEGLLEFLGTFETADGKWIDPATLDPHRDRPRPAGGTPTRSPVTGDPKPMEAPDEGPH